MFLSYLLLYSTSAEGVGLDKDGTLMLEKLVERRKNSMTRPRQPQTCSQPIYTGMLT